MKVTSAARAEKGERAVERVSRGSLPLATITPYLYLVPMVAMVTVFLLYPAADTIWISFTRWDGLHQPVFVGLGNYLKWSTDPAFLTSSLNTVFWVVGVLVLQVGLGLVLAVILNAALIAELYKRILYLPATISGASAAVIWYSIFNPDLGLVNTTLRFLHLGGLAHSWLTTPPLNTFAMIVASAWQGLGPAMVLFLVGLQNIPRDPVEAAQVDGAGGWRLFRHVTLPLLRPMTVVVVAISLINSFKVFDLIWVMTQGGPYRSSETLAVTMYRDSFVGFQFGYGASVAVLLTAIVFLVSVFYIRSMFQRLEVG